MIRCCTAVKYPITTQFQIGEFTPKLLELKWFFCNICSCHIFLELFHTCHFFIESSWSWAFPMLSLVNEHAAASPPLYNISAWISLQLVLNTLTVGIHDSLLFCWWITVSKIELISSASHVSLYSLMQLSFEWETYLKCGLHGFGHLVCNKWKNENLLICSPALACSLYLTTSFNVC